MNAILLTAIWGIIMMFGGVFFKSKQTPKYWAIAGLVLIIISNYVELTTGASFFDIDTKFMLSFNSFNLTFITIALVSTLLYFLLRKDINFGTKSKSTRFSSRNNTKI